VNPRKTLAAAQRNPRDVRFSHLQSLAEAVGFSLARVFGSHHIYIHPDVDAPVNIQPDKNGKAKAYQVRQFLDIVERYELLIEDEA
jgi:predicted RNA binding protein YcfA (HicA-like mRNA interferase family)